MLNKNALKPNPARTVPVALARDLSGKDLAMAFTDEDRPAEPPQPVRNIARQRRVRRGVEGGEEGERRMGMERV